MRYGIRKRKQPPHNRVWRRWRKFRVHIGLPGFPEGTIFFMPDWPMTVEFNPADFEKYWMKGFEDSTIKTELD